MERATRTPDRGRLARNEREARTGFPFLYFNLCPKRVMLVLAMPSDVRRRLCPAVSLVMDVGLRPRFFETEKNAIQDLAPFYLRLTADVWVKVKW
ncbi:MAG TPA: hypothetical protein VJV03_19390 [Pyrinomonadaceae bacterium]|nr:hypothetical protein [Pyrinomonadaceae bacterium]